jgi:long-chain acyl-CoA synthetase
MERVELLTELEQRFQVRVPQATAQEIFTVRQLADALRVAEPAGERPADAAAKTESWSVILRDLPPASDPVLGSLLRRRPLAAPILFLLSRIVRLLLPRIEVTGLERLPSSGAYIISPNHQSYLDPVFVCAVLPFRVFRNLFFVGAVEYFETPLTRWVARTINLVPVDPDSNLVPAMKAGAFGLTHGRILVLFPEGERSIDGTVKKFKKGSPILAQHLGVPIVPVAIKGVFELWPRNRAFNWRALVPFKHRVSVIFGESMTFAEGAAYAESALQLRERVNEMWERVPSL